MLLFCHYLKTSGGLFWGLALTASVLSFAQAAAPPAPAQSATTYSYTANGQIDTLDGPRTDVQDYSGPQSRDQFSHQFKI
jgi:uncharacterized membrane protein